MEKTFLLGYGNQKFSLKAQRGLYLFLGMLFLLQGAVSLAREGSLAAYNVLLTSTQIVGGIFFLFLGVTMLSPTSRFSPKFRLTENNIEFRDSFFSANVVIRWADIVAISIRSYGLDFYLREGECRIDYKSTAEISKEVKAAISEVALAKGIEVNRS